MRRLAVIAGVVLLAVGGASARSARASEAGGLERFQSCDAFVDYVSDKMLPLVTPWGFGWGSSVPLVAATSAVGAATTGHTSPAISGTNVQEAGVDEPDIVKADRSRLYALVDQKLVAVDVSHPRPQVLGSLALGDGADQQLLLHRNRIFVIAKEAQSWGWGGGGVIVSPPLAGNGRTTITEIDVSNAHAMLVVGRLTLDASYVSARRIGGTARIVATSQLTPHDIPFVTPTDSTPEALAAALAQNRAILKSSTAANWLPRYELGTTSGSLAACDQISRPSTYAGLGLLSVLTLDLEKGLEPVDSDAIIEDGQTVYSSRDSLYVATYRRYEPVLVEPGQPPPAQVFPLPARTALHKFDTSVANVTEYRASGTVPGTVRDQWSLSEHNGVLRAVTTDIEPATQSLVTLLAERKSKLVQLGQLGGLGRNENLYAVRFVGDIGYVVTFRQRDPLLTLDVSEPTRPRLVGRLDLLGYSSYLHPLTDDLLLGVGQDADEWGFQTGTQLAIFDVADLRRPARLDHRRIGYASSEAEVDHHAFLYWRDTSLLVVPVGRTGSNRFVGAVAFRVNGRQLDDPRRTAARLQPLGRLEHWGNGYRFAVRRSFVIGKTLYTVSERGVRANDTITLGDRGWAGFETPATRLRHAALPD